MRHQRTFQNRSLQPGRDHRSGAACIEAAMTLPILCVLVFASIEVANIVYLRQSLNIAAYEAGMSASKPGATETKARQRADELLSSRNITNYTLTFTPTVTEATQSGTQIEVDVSCPSGTFSIGPMWLFKDKTIRSTAFMARL